MKCPACDHPLAEFVMGGVKLDACQGGCGGIWFDAFELARVGESLGTPGTHLLQVDRDPARVVDLQRKRACPRCEGIKLKRHFSSAQRKIEVDDCPNCGGCWLDAGELQQLRSEQVRREAATTIQVAAISMETIRYLYRSRSERNP